MLPQRPQEGSAPQRIYLVGAHATGKTTLARWIRDRYRVPMIAEVARGVLAEMEAQLETLRTDVDLVDRYQAAVFTRQIDAERGVDGAFVSDRAFCNLAYAAHHSSILAKIFRDPRLEEYMQWVRQGVVFFLRPHREMLVDDGVVQHVSVDEGSVELKATSAEAMMMVVDPETQPVAESADAAQLGLALVVAAGVVFAAKPDLFTSH